MDSSCRNVNFDILRLVLALEVVGLHLNASLTPWLTVVPAVASFVCLSGFLIPASFNASRSVAHFAWKRFLRVTPALVLSFILCAALLGVRTVVPTLVWYITAGLVVIPGTSNGPLWTLIIEEVLYAWHCICRRVLLAWSPRAAGISAAVCYAVSIAFNIFQLQPRFHFGLATSFFLGNILYFYRDRIFHFRWWQPVLVLVFGLINAMDYTQTAQCLTMPLSAFLCLIVVGSFPIPQIQWADLSYGIYVYHHPIILALSAAGLRNPQHVAASIAATVLVASASWFLIEKPALRAKNWKRETTEANASTSVEKEQIISSIGP